MTSRVSDMLEDPSEAETQPISPTLEESGVLEITARTGGELVQEADRARTEAAKLREHFMGAVADKSELSRRLEYTADEIKFYQLSNEALNLEMELLVAQRELRRNDVAANYTNWQNTRKRLEALKLLHRSQWLKVMLQYMDETHRREQAELVIEMFEKRFGSREQLYKLAREEERRCIDPRYNTIATILHDYDAGKLPRPGLGERVVRVFERAVDLGTKFYNAIFERKRKS